MKSILERRYEREISLQTEHQQTGGWRLMQNASRIFINSSFQYNHFNCIWNQNKRINKFQVNWIKNVFSSFWSIAFEFVFVFASWEIPLSMYLL